MLKLDQTALLLDAFRPPQNMEIDVAVGTTFTLDLTALLTIPVAASFDAITDGPEPADLLETIRRYAERTVLFCQAGAVKTRWRDFPPQGLDRPVLGPRRRPASPRPCDESQPYLRQGLGRDRPS
jgi:hypothetical protein